MANLGSTDTPVAAESLDLPNEYSVAVEETSGDLVVEDPNANIVLRWDETDGKWQLGDLTNADQAFADNSSMIHDRDEVTVDAATDGSGYYRVDTSGGDVTLTLVAADAVDGRETNIKNTGGGTTTVESEGSATVEGEASIDLDQDGQSVTLVYNDGEDDWEIF